LLVPRLEKSLGIEVYATCSLGIGGVIREDVEDFVVEEVLVDGSKAEAHNIEVNAEKAVLGSSSIKNRYLLCVLVKRNWDTFIALQNIAQQLGINPRQIHIAGIKDAKAVTAQHITIEGISTEDVENVNLKDIRVRSIGYLRTRLSPYYLLGNNFHIKIKCTKHSNTAITNRITRTVEELNTLGGIPNFFGHQRFGTTRPITHLVGKALVKGSLKKAAMLFLAKSSLYEHPLSRQARRELQATQDFKRALTSFPKQLRYERLMLKSLAERPCDFAAAFKRLPIKLRELFTQAYESYLFNRFLSGRIKNSLSLTTAEVGDYVINVERSGLPMPKMYKTTSTGNLAEINNAIEKEKMRLAIPLIGFKQRTSQGIQGDIEHGILEKEGVSPRDFKFAPMPEMSSRGELRAMVAPVKNLSLNHVVGDMGAVRGRTLKVDFMLYRGSYATIVLRELMKPRNPIEAGF
jgi:tRNA pseudouridine13 synthase